MIRDIGGNQENIELTMEEKISKTETGKMLDLAIDYVKYHIRKMTENKKIKWVATSRKGNWILLEE